MTASSARPTRLHPDHRRAEIVRAARTVFLGSGYRGAGLAEVAAAGDVSRGSIYRYFPSGRADLYLAVVESLLGELHERLRYAASAPFSATRRMEQLLAALFAFFEEEPAAHRLLFREVWATGEPEVEDAAAAARALLTSEIAALLAGPGDASADELVAASVGILGFALANVELALGGELDAETAWRVTCRYATAHLGGA